MKIIVMWVDFFHYLDSFVHAFENLGHDALKIGLRDFKEEVGFFKTRLAKCGMKCFKVRYEKQKEAEHESIIHSYNPKVCLIVNGDRTNQKFLEFLKNKNIKIVLFMLDSIREDIYQKTLKNISYYDYIFSYESLDIEFLKGYCKHVKYLPVGYDKSVFSRLEIDISQQIDICFVGGISDRLRLSILERIAQYSIAAHKTFVVYTNSLINKKNPWKFILTFLKKEKFKKIYPYLYKCLIDQPVYNKDLANVYQNSKICINLHHSNDTHHDASPRTFEILGCGSFEIIDAGHLRHTSLEAGKHLIEFNDVEDLIDKIEYYLMHDDERREIAKAGYEMAQEKYTMDKCADVILREVCNE